MSDILKKLSLNNKMKYFGFYKGIVRDVKEKGMIAVEVLPFYKGIPKEELPLAEPMFPFQALTTPPINSTVWVVFDNGDILKPIYVSQAIPIKNLPDVEEWNDGKEYQVKGNTICQDDDYDNKLKELKRKSNSEKVFQSEKEINDYNYPHAKTLLFEDGTAISVDVVNNSILIYQGSTGNYIEINKNQIHIHSTKDTNIYTKGNTRVSTKGNTYVYSDGSAKILAKGDAKVYSDSNLKVACKGNMDILAKGLMQIISSSQIIMKAPTIQRNPDIDTSPVDNEVSNFSNEKEK